MARQPQVAKHDMAISPESGFLVAQLASLCWHPLLVSLQIANTAAALQPWAGSWHLALPSLRGLQAHLVQALNTCQRCRAAALLTRHGGQATFVRSQPTPSRGQPVKSRAGQDKCCTASTCRAWKASSDAPRCGAWTSPSGLLCSTCRLRAGCSPAPMSSLLQMLLTRLQRLQACQKPLQ